MGYLDNTGLAYFWEKIKSNFFPATKEIPANADLNDYDIPGAYNCPTNAAVATLDNAPTTKAFSLIVYRTGMSNSCVQFLSVFSNGLSSQGAQDDANRIFTRTYYYGDGWSPWVEIATSLDRPVDYTSAGWTLDTYADHCWHKMATFRNTNSATDRRAVFLVTDSYWYATSAPNGRPDLKLGLLHVHIRKTVGVCASTRRLSFNLNTGYDPNDFVLVYNPVDDSDELWTRIAIRYTHRTFNLIETGLHYGGNRYYQATVNPIEMYRRVRDNEGYDSYPTGEGYVAIKAENSVVEQPSRGLLDLGLYYNQATIKRLTTANAFLAGKGALEYYNSTSSISIDNGAFTYPDDTSKRDAHVLRLPWDNVGASDGACYDGMVAVPNRDGVTSNGYPASMGWRTGYGAGCAEQDADGNMIHTKYSDWYHLIDDRYTIDGVHVKKQHTTHYGVCSTAAATAIKVVDIPHFELVTGAYVIVTFTETNSAAVANLKLNVSNTGDIAIKYRNGNVAAAGDLIANRPFLFVYDGTNWQLGIDIDKNTANTTNTQSVGGSIAASVAIAKYNIIVNNGSGYFQLNTGNTFDITWPIMYTTANIAINKTAAPWIQYHFAITTTQSIALTTRQPVFIKGTLNGTKFTPVSATPITQTIPTQEDGYQYLYLGWAYSETNIQMLESHPIYEYVNGSFCLYEPKATDAEIDALFD